MAVAGQVDSGGGDPLVEINVTPMVDVLLSLLIIFMVAQPKPPNEKIPLNVPKTPQAQSATDPNATLILSIDEDGRATLGKTPLPLEWSAMVEQIKANEKAVNDDRIAIKAADKTKYGRVIEVMAAAHEAGIGKVGIASERL